MKVTSSNEEINVSLLPAVDKFGKTVDFLLTKRRMRGSAQIFLRKAISNNDKPRIINRNLLTVRKIKIRQCKYLNNIVEQDHRNIKRRISIDTGFKEFESAKRTLAGIEVVNIIRKDQIANSSKTTFKTFCSLAV